MPKPLGKWPTPEPWMRLTCHPFRPELEQERDEARNVSSTTGAGYRALEMRYREEYAAHRRTRRLALVLGLVVAALFVLLVISVFVAWLLFQ